MHFGYCHFVIKYLMRDMMNYYCLRVFRSRVKRDRKTLARFFYVPNQSAGLFRCWARDENFGTRIHSVDPEHRFPTLIFFKFFFNDRALLNTEVEESGISGGRIEPAQTKLNSRPLEYSVSVDRPLNWRIMKLLQSNSCSMRWINSVQAVSVERPV